jgi:uncharacterized protein
VKAIIKDIILENQNRELPVVLKRRLEVPLNLPVIVSLVGSRRSGKTSMLYHLITTLRKNGLEKEKILFINFEDERLTMDATNLDMIIQAYRELFPETELKDVYFFFDEIQNVSGWEKFVRRLFDTLTRKIFITGSNSRLLSTEIATALRGRTISFTLYPLSFGEYLDFKQINKSINTQKSRSTLIHYAEQFLRNGGFPELTAMDDHNRVKLLQEYFNVMIFRDIVERYQVSNTDALRFFIKKIFAGVSKPFSVNKAYNDLRSMGYKISNKYLYEYFNYCNDVFLCQSISKFDYSEIKQSKSEKKTYVIDTGLLSAIEFSVSKNQGKLLENMVFLEFLKSGKEIFYFKGQHECDFIVKEGNSYTPCQVSWNFDDTSTRERELRGLNEACEYLGVNEGNILCFDHEEETTWNNKKVNVLPVYKFFLEN